MRDVERQVREYFDAAIERVTFEDILARRRVTEQVHEVRLGWVRRPAWAGLAAFAVTVVVLGGSLALGAAVNQPELDVGSVWIPEAVGEGAATTSGWWLLIPAIAVAIATVAALIVRNQQVRAKKERTMATTIETTPTEQLKTAERNNRWLVAAVVVLAVALVALGAWVLYDMASEPETAASDEITAVLDDYNAAWNEGDDDAFRELTSEGYTFTSGDTTANRDVQAVSIVASSTFDVRRVGDLVVMGDGPEYFVVAAEEIAYGGGDFVGVSAYRVVETEEGLKVAEHTWVGNL